MTDETNVAPEAPAPVTDPGAPAEVAPSAGPTVDQLLQTPANPSIQRTPEAPAPTEPEQDPLAGHALFDRGEGTGTHLEGDQAPAEGDAEAPASEYSSLTDLLEDEFSNDPGASLVYQNLNRLLGDTVDSERAFLQAIEEQDARFIDEAYLREALGDDADYAIQAASYLIDFANNHAANMLQGLYDSVEGGEQAVQLAARSFKETASEEQLELVRSMLDSGNAAYMRHAVQLMTQQSQVRAPRGINPVQAAVAHEPPLTREEFGQLVVQNPGMSNAEYSKLTARLAAGMSR